MSHASVTQLRMGSLQLPPSHPRAAQGDYPVHAFVIHHGDGLILVDTGVGYGNEFIDDLYTPEVVPLVEALGQHGIDERDIRAIVHTHLHFDHCGQNDALPGRPTWVTAAELATVSDPWFTVSEWATIDDEARRLSTDGETIAEGVRLLHTPGHTPGHQSVVIDRPNSPPEVIVGQCCHDHGEFVAGGPDDADMHDEALIATGRASLERLRALEPSGCWYSHRSGRFP